MQLSPALTLSLLLSLLSLLPSNAHNITHILSGHPDFSTFNHYLTLTHLAAEINRRETITVCAVDNAAMSTLLAKHLPLSTLHNVLSLHVFADYFGAKKLHQIPKGSTLTATLFQATGEASGTSGYVNITNQKGGRVSFAAIDHAGDLSATFVKSVFELPYNISVIQISHILTSAEAEAPNPSPTLNLTTLISKQGCTSFSDLLISSGALDTFNENLDGGLTVFCPSDAVFDCVHAQTLKSSNGLMNTLATDGAEKFDFTVQNDGDNVMLKTKVVTASVTATVVDKEPLIAYKIDKVLLPAELFKPAKAAPAPKAEKAGCRGGRAGAEARRTTRRRIRRMITVLVDLTAGH
ncbi:FASCICLIN-like arabinogalactan 2 [Actinidia rufa]|uniref:FASCICLIN-like arabinogalactan 2 n=1 Tax=Actinidia rufa TaxID=165716 RepID=A0A7J0G3R4_9ERIC|nr:FASCICLIN-like arabinogalactan 2 [Actinidia rufa]